MKAVDGTALMPVGDQLGRIDGTAPIQRPPRRLPEPSPTMPGLGRVLTTPENDPKAHKNPQLIEVPPEPDRRVPKFSHRPSLKRPAAHRSPLALEAAPSLESAYRRATTTAVTGGFRRPQPPFMHRPPSIPRTARSPLCLSKPPTSRIRRNGEQPRRR